MVINLEKNGGSQSYFFSVRLKTDLVVTDKLKPIALPHTYTISISKNTATYYRLDRKKRRQYFWFLVFVIIRSKQKYTQRCCKNLPT